MIGHLLKLSKQQNHNSSSKGFTIVELLIVVVVIGILAAIVTVAYTGIQQRAQVSAITSELKQWQKLFEAYKAINGSYPLPVAPPAEPTTSGGPGSNIDDGYCLGTGFPGGHCYLPYASSYGVAESTGAYLLSQLATVGTPPQNSAKYTYETVGPFLWYRSDIEVRLSTTYPASATDACPAGTIQQYLNTVRRECFL